jgi:hypothetical protein
LGTAPERGNRALAQLRLLLAVLACAVLLPAAPAAAYIYFGYGSAVGQTFIGRANLAGGDVNDEFIKVPPAPNGSVGACGMTVTSTYLYWSECNGTDGTAIGRANLDGSGVDNLLETGDNPCAVFVFGSYIYWDGDGPDELGRANLDGSGANPNFLPPGDAACGVAVNSSYIYYANYQTGDIGRAKLDGTDLDTTFITGLSSPGGLAIDSSHIYWVSLTGIGRANLDGTDVQPNLVTGAPADLGATGPSQVAIDGSHIYWAAYLKDQIGRANLDGTDVDYDYVTTAPGLFGIAVDDLGPPLPVLGRSVDAAPVSGAVLARLPGGHRFERLRTGQRIPVGSVLDAAGGVVDLTAAAAAKRFYNGRFYGGEFRITQERGSGPQELTVLKLTGPGPDDCGAGDAVAAGLRRHHGRQLWGVAHGNFETVGGYASATERGTKWLTQDTCAGTLIHVTQGAVSVHDFPHHRSFLLKAPHSFTAHPGRGG